ncbi:MAG: M20 family metallopeptidase [Myxococcota bacterium]
MHALVLAAVLGAGIDYWESFYQDLHRHPEVGFKEKRTSAKVAGELKRLGLKTFEVGGGVVAILENGAGPVTLVRSELDALPITEETGLPYKSENAGVMHACGHDLHATTLIASAEAMKQEKAKWRGTLVFVAQPAEEILKGAKSMLDAGLAGKIPKPDQCVSMHVNPYVPTGKVGFTAAGPMMTAADNFEVVFRGFGAHGSQPHKGIDPVVIAAEFVIKMQTLVGREANPLETAVITVGTIHGGTAGNIIPEEVKLGLTMRTFDAATRARLVKRIPEIAAGLAKTAAAPEPTVTSVSSVPPVVNDAALTDKFRAGVATRIGRDNVVDAALVMASEDFSLFGPAFGVPVLRFLLGASSDPSFTVSNHNPKFAPQVKTVLPIGIQATVGGLLELHRL